MLWQELKINSKMMKREIRYRRIPKVAAPLTFGFIYPLLGTLLSGEAIFGGRYFRVVKYRLTYCENILLCSFLFTTFNLLYCDEGRNVSFPLIKISKVYRLFTFYFSVYVHNSQYWLVVLKCPMIKFLVVHIFTYL